MNLIKKLYEKIKLNKEKSHSLEVNEISFFDSLNKSEKDFCIINSNQLNMINEIINHLEEIFNLPLKDKSIKNVEEIEFSIHQNNDKGSFLPNPQINLGLQTFIKFNNIEGKKSGISSNDKMVSYPKLKILDVNDYFLDDKCTLINEKVSFEGRKEFYKKMLNDYFNTYENNLITSSEINEYCNNIEKDKIIYTKNNDKDYILLSYNKGEKQFFNFKQMLKTDAESFNEMTEEVTNKLYEIIKNKTENLSILFNRTQDSSLYSRIGLKLHQEKELNYYFLLSKMNFNLLLTEGKDILFDMSVINTNSFDSTIESIITSLLSQDSQLKEYVKYKSIKEYIAEEEKMIINTQLNKTSFQETLILDKRRL